ncbi:zinc-binding dehydrogenase [Streptomyces sp. NBC_00878]|uniref:zinc-binding dehydrogenase n=1 Tax=Streptomyces sp. NBC_00878 TaxID=2975854 RepID=UPI00224E3B52|nr:zinc-binding dehydrogenase [Streptomyces sp. NBC_00878]MCX4906539.1 zinc-binding dehydrogenase [Streptomyces sp. NBC_00878]
MRALIPTGNPETLTELGEVDLPTPQRHEVLIRVTDVALNRADFLYLSDPSTTFRPGIDAAGVVAKAAVDGSGPSEGSRVALHLPSGGGAAEYVAASADRLAVIPDNVDSASAAALPLGGLVAQRLLALAGPLEGRRILATGVGGGVGQVLIQLAVAEGAEITAVAAQGQPTDHMAALGAKIALDIDAVEDTAFDIVLESVGGDLGSKTAHKLRPGGQFLWFGQASGSPITLDFFRQVQGGTSLTLRHFVYGDGDGSRDAQDMNALLDLASQGKLQVEIGRRDNWAVADSLLKEMAAGRLRGKAVLDVD